MLRSACPRRGGPVGILLWILPPGTSGWPVSPTPAGAPGPGRGRLVVPQMDPDTQCDGNIFN